MFQDDLSVLLRVLVACVLAGILGWERESAGKAAGLRTHILVGVAAVLFTVIGEFMAVSFRAYGDHVRFDAANLVGAIVTGISFLGAGMIIFRKEQRDVRGLTTAAGILTMRPGADTEILLRHFRDAEKECKALLEAGTPGPQANDKRHKLALPAYDQCIKASHIFNLLDARGVISVTERQGYILRVRELAKASCAAWLATEGGGA